MTRKVGRAVGFRTLGDVQAAARRSVDAGVWGFIEGGSGEERTLRANVAAFERWTLRPDVLQNVREVGLGTTLLGSAVSAPFFVAPTAYHREVHPGGERATAAAASALGVLGVYSTLSSDSLEAIAEASGTAPRWFQLYLQAEFSDSLALVRRAERAGYSALVVTVDTPVLGSRDRQGRSGFAVRRAPPVGNGRGARMPPRGSAWDGAGVKLAGGGEESWATIDRLRRSTRLPIVLKGVLTAATARRSVAHGARAVIVSNHGGRQLDLAPATLDALPEVVKAVGRRAEVYVDGGVRRGSDVAVALALGARGVGIGRPILWALAAGGRAGVERYLRLLGTELSNTLVLLGRSSPAALDRRLVAPAGTR